MTATVMAAVVQMTSTADVERNLASAESLVRRAASVGARFVSLPENFAFLRSEGEPVVEAQALDGPWVHRMSGLARELGITLLLGSLPEKIAAGLGDAEHPPAQGASAGSSPVRANDHRVHNTSVLIGPDGDTLAVYRKIHLFDIDLPGMEHLKESRAVRPGEDAVVARAPFGPLGLTICYDLRFPELYRALVRAGARVLAVPSAFTERTGKDHWEVLLRARAVENLAYVVAAAQVGHHGRGRSSHGHAMIVDPWGAVMAQVPDGEGVAVAELDFARQDRLRRELPALDHARPFKTSSSDGPAGG
jgi:predicted amidohydrolase